jgi:8-oxo-dGTP diphosphatase
MQKTYIDKLAFIDIKDKTLLSTLSKGKNVWYIPGGKREGNESDHEALIREVKEELTVDLIPETITYYGTFEAQAHGKLEGTVVRMTCYTATFSGELQASSEIAEYRYVDYSWKEKSSPVDKLIFDDLYNKGLIK